MPTFWAKRPLSGQNAHFLGKTPIFRAKCPRPWQNAHFRAKCPFPCQNERQNAHLAAKCPTKCRGERGGVTRASLREGGGPKSCVATEWWKENA